MAEGEPIDVADARTPSRPPVGILLVHGIGEQPRGDTLVRFGEPILHWISRWLGPDRQLTLERACIERQNSPDSDGPPRFVMSIDSRGLSAAVADRASAFDAVAKTASAAARAADRPGAAGDAGNAIPRQESEEWIVAESWWAPHVRRPPFGLLARWMLSRGPWVILSHYGDGLRVADGWRKVPALLKCVAALVAALLLQILVALTAMLAAIPWPRLRDALSGLLLALTGTLGDSYVLIESPVQRAAAVTQTRQDLQWLAARCRTVVVIAHSQGTAIAREALRTSGRQVAAFLTFGQGLRKLEELRYLTTNWTWFFSALSFSLPLTALVVCLSFYPPPELQGSENLGMARYFLIAYPGLVLLQVLVAAVSGSAYRQELAALKLGNDIRWIDFYSRIDPVPGGSLGESVPGVTSKEVYNLASLTGDHTAYWKNRDQFVAAIVREIDRAAGPRLFAPGDEQFVERIAATRPRRVRVLALVRWACMLSVPLLAYGLRLDLRAIGAFVLNPLIALPLVGTIGRLLQEAGRLVEHVAIVLPCAAFNEKAPWCIPGAPAPDGLAALGVALLTLAVLAWYGLADRLWYTWDELSVKQLFTPTSFGERNERVLVAVAATICGLFPLAVGVVSSLGSNLQDIGLFAWSAVWMIPMLPMAALVIVLPLVLAWLLGRAGVAGYRKVREWL
jgi:hypothetical protein